MQTLVPDVILEVVELSKVFGRRRALLDAWRRVRAAQLTPRPALVDVSFTLERGAVLGVVGESGSGKSTLARCIAQLEQPTSGRVLFDGNDLTTLRHSSLRRQRRRIQIIFQDPYSSLNPRMTAGSAIGEVLRVHRLVARDKVAARVQELLALVGLPPSAAERYPSAFSGGQRQRIAIARALAAEPDLLIADEAVSALDVSIQAQVVNLLQRLRDEFHLTMIFISHDLPVVHRIAPRIAVMFGGRIVELLPPDVRLSAAQHPYTRALLAAAPSLERRPPEALEEPDLSQTLPLVGCPYRERCIHAFEPCELIDPPLNPIAPDHLVACHYVAGEVGVWIEIPSARESSC